VRPIYDLPTAPFHHFSRKRNPEPAYIRRSVGGPITRLAILFLAPPFLALAFPLRSEAQVDESLLTRRWKADDFWAETYDRLYFTARGSLEETGEHIQFFHWDSDGRIKFGRKDLEPSVWLGYKANTLSVSSEAEALHHTFADAAVAVALRVGAIDEDWTVQASAGIGTANDGRWDNLHALYPTAAVDFAREIDIGTLHLGLSLDGNRNIFPRYPWPYLEVESRLGTRLDVLWGFPKTEIMFRPFKPIILSLQWAFIEDASARIEGDLGSGFSLFAEVSRHVDGFHLRHEERLREFFVSSAVELGFRWVTKYMDVSLTVGYAFGQRIFTGDNLLDRTPVASVENLPFIGLTFPSTFWAAPFSSGVPR